MLSNAPWAFWSSVEDDTGVDPVHMRTYFGVPGQAVVGAFDEQGVLLGVVGLIRTNRLKLKHRVRIWGVYVAPRARRGGVGRAMLRRAIEEARSWPGVASVALSVSANSHGAAALYRSLGFVPWGVEPGCLVLADGTSYDEIHMVLELAAPTA